MSNKNRWLKKPIKKTAVVTTASFLSLSISTALYAAEPVGVQTTDQPLTAIASSPLPKRFIIKYKQSDNAQTFSTMSDASSDTSNFSTANNTVEPAAFRRVREMKRKIQSIGGQVKGEYPNLNMISVELAASDIATLASDDNVDYIEEDLPRRFMSQSIPYGISMVQQVRLQ